MDFHRSLAFRILVPVVGFTVLLGMAIIVYGYHAIDRFSREQAATNLRLRAYTARQIADDYREQLHQVGGAGNSGERDRRVAALLRMEDFARINGVQIEVYDAVLQRPISLGDLGVSFPVALQESREVLPEFQAGSRRYQAYRVAYDPWHWQLALIQDTRVYDQMRRDLMRAAGVAAFILLVSVGIVLAYLMAVLRRPIASIVADVKAGRQPSYAGIAEFEFLSRSLSAMMASEKAKAAMIARYNERLEQQVEARTAALNQSNEVLQKANRQLAKTHVQLLQSEQLASIGQLVAAVAHEINNPLGFVRSNLLSLERYVRDMLRLIDAHQAADPTHPALGEARPELPTVADLKRMVDLEAIRSDVLALLKESREGLNRVAAIVQDLKGLSRAGQAEEWQSADLNLCLDDALHLAVNEVEHKARVVKAYGGLPRVECMPSRLNQVFLNLIVNAAQAIPDHGTITLATGSEGSWVWAAVSDTGSGIAPENLNRIFDPLFTTKPAGQGTGLGLAVSHDIVARHRGRIEVDSKVGIGTTFKVWLPVQRGERHGEPAREGPIQR